MDISESTITEVFSNAIVVVSELFLKEVPEDKESFLNRIGSIAEVTVICKSKGNFAAQGSWKKIIAFEDALKKAIRNLRSDTKISISCSKENYESASFEMTLGRNSQQILTDAFNCVENHSDGQDKSNVEPYSCLLISENPNAAEISQINTLPISVLSPTEESFKNDKRKGNEIYVNITLSTNSSLSLSADDHSVRSNSHEVKDDELTINATDEIRKEPGLFENTLSAPDDIILEQLSEKDKRKFYEQQTPFKFFCTMCSFKSKRESHYKKHLQLHKKGTTKLFVCIQCGFRTIRMGHLRRHELQHSSQALRCPWCPYTTDSSTFLQRHQRIKHASNSKQNSHGENFLSCSHCTYVTSQPHFLKRHLKVHGIGKDPNKSLTVSYECEKCTYKTRRKEHFERHRRDVHSELRPFLCDTCGKAFKRADALRQHRAARHQPFISNEGKIVSGSSHYSLYCCPQCSKPCRSRAHLRDHLATHSDERSFLCEVCGSSFKTRAVQRKHVATVHANPKAFPCNRCVRKFSTKYALLRHLKIHGFVKDDAARSTAKVESVVLNCMEISQTKAGYHEVQSIESSTVLLENQQLASENEVSISTKDLEVESQGQSSSQLQVSHKVVTVLPVVQEVSENKGLSDGGMALEIEGDINSVNSAALTRTPAPSETTTALLYLTHDFTQY